MNKRVALLADLDALADDGSLVSHFSELPGAAAIADKLGRRNLSDLDCDLRGDLFSFMETYQTEVDAAAETYPDWSTRESGADATRRVTLARILVDPASFESDAAINANTLGREVILIAQREVDVPFDLQHIRYIKYLNNAEG